MRCAGLGPRVAWAGTAIMGVPTVAQARTFVASDVHVGGTAAAMIDRESGKDPHDPHRRNWPGLSQAGFDGDLDSRVLSLGRGRLRPYAPSEEVSARAA